jgi:hypothetical protein
MFKSCAISFPITRISTPILEPHGHQRQRVISGEQPDDPDPVLINLNHLWMTVFGIKRFSSF